MAKKISELTESTNPATDAVVAVEEAGVTYKVPLLYLPAAQLNNSLTLNFDNTMTVAEMQAEIDAVPENLNNYSLTVQFADGAYTMANRLFFNSFQGYQILIYGNTGEANATDLHTTQAVDLNFTSSPDDSGIRFYQCSVANIEVRNLKVQFDAGVFAAGIYFQRCSGYCQANYNYLLGDAAGGGHGVRYDSCPNGIAQENYFSGGANGIFANINSKVFSTVNDDTGTQPNYGLRAFAGATISKSSTQPAGSTANEGTQTGGVIR